MKMRLIREILDIDQHASSNFLASLSVQELERYLSYLLAQNPRPNVFTLTA